MDEQMPLAGSGPRLVSPAEFAAVLRVTEDDVREWIGQGKLPFEPGPDGEPLLRITEEGGADEGPSDAAAAISASLVFYSTGELTREKLDGRRRERQVESYDYDGPIDLGALVAALSRRMAAVVPDGSEEAPHQGVVYGVDVPAALAGGEDRGVEELVAGIAERVMESASERVADDTAEPWPARAGQFEGGFPPVGTEVRDGAVWMWWGLRESPVLELEPLLIEEVLTGFTAS